MAAAVVEAGNIEIYNPRKILDHPDFRVLQTGEKPEPGANIAAFYNPAHEIHLVQKPRPRPGPGQVLVHVRASGICGCVFRVLYSILLLDVDEYFFSGVMCIFGNMGELVILWLFLTRWVLWSFLSIDGILVEIGGFYV